LKEKRKKYTVRIRKIIKRGKRNKERKRNEERQDK
jgi:hypothetical protein